MKPCTPDYEVVPASKLTQDYLSATAEIATVYDHDGRPYTIQVFVNNRTDEGYLCLFPHDVTKRINLTVGIGPRYRFENGNAILVKKFEGDPEPVQPPKIIVSTEPTCCQ